MLSRTYNWRFHKFHHKLDGYCVIESWFCIWKHLIFPCLHLVHVNRNSDHKILLLLSTWLHCSFTSMIKILPCERFCFLDTHSMNSASLQMHAQINTVVPKPNTSIYDVLVWMFQRPIVVSVYQSYLLCLSFYN